MFWRKIIQVLILFFIILVPIKVLAVDFEIPVVKIDAYLQENGDAEVVEKHTYVFDSEFNGVTRELIAKKGSSIIDFIALENGEALKVEHEKGTYKIFRSGNEETIEVELHYRIVDGVEKYEDGAQFYWPFFDDRNESDYGQMNIEIHPPSIASDVLYLGYDTAYEKGAIGADGIVTFSMGDVSAGENGDIRIIYAPDLFPNVVERQGEIRDEVITEQKRLADEEAAYLVGATKTEKYGLIGFSAIGALLLWFVGKMASLRKRRKKEAVFQLGSAGLSVPPEKMSIPATIYYTSSGVISSEATSAALLDLVRQGKLKQLSDEEFEVVDRFVKQPHEEALLGLLVDQIGDGVRFNMNDLETYTKNKKNHGVYQKALFAWRQGIVKEVKSHHLVEQKKGVRWSLVVIGLVFAVGAVQFIRYELFAFMAIAFVLTFSAWLFAVFYTPRSLEGHIIIEEWARLKKAMIDVDLDEWNKLSTNDKFRAYTYGIGLKDKAMASHFSEFADAEKRVSTRDSGDTGMYYFNPVYISSSFNSANTNAAVDASGTSTSSSSSGGGAGGGGGGSGAF